MVTAANQWKKSSSGDRVELKLPSGNTCLAKAPGMEAIMAGGFIPNSLLAILMEQLEKNSGKPAKTKAQEVKEQQEFMTAIKGDPEKIAEIFVAVDHVTVDCVVQPEVHPVPVDEKDRDPDLLYVDEVDFDDKMFIFNFAVGGSKDLDRFRNSVADGVESLQASKPVPRPTKRTTSRK